MLSVKGWGRRSVLQPRQEFRRDISGLTPWLAALNLGWERRPKETRVSAWTPRSNPNHARTNICAAGVFSCADILRREASARVFSISKTIHSIMRFRRRTLRLITANGSSITPLAAYLVGLEEFRWTIVVITAIGRQSLFQRATGPAYRINRSLDTPLLLHIRGYSS